MDEKETIIKALEGDVKSFELIIKKYEKIIFSIIFTKIRNYNDTLDISQEVFLKVFRKLKTFDINRNFFSWLVKITINEINKYFRDKKNEKLNIDDLNIIDFEFSNEMITNEDKIDLLNSLEILKTKEKVLIIMKYFEGYSIEEIAEIVGMKISAVKVTLMRAKEKIFKFLSD